jgi:hypothetical protein
MRFHLHVFHNVNSKALLISVSLSGRKVDIPYEVVSNIHEIDTI